MAHGNRARGVTAKIKPNGVAHYHLLLLWRISLHWNKQLFCGVDSAFTLSSLLTPHVSHLLTPSPLSLFFSSFPNSLCLFLPALQRGQGQGLGLSLPLALPVAFSLTGWLHCGFCLFSLPLGCCNLLAVGRSSCAKHVPCLTPLPVAWLFALPAAACAALHAHFLQLELFARRAGVGTGWTKKERRREEKKGRKEHAHLPAC